ncbi:MAG: Gfo/Idh/MocA family protein [Planctomycetota bacterium]
MAQGDFGPITAVAMDFACTRGAAYFHSDPWRGSWQGEGGGLLINQAIHSLDLALWLGGCTPRTVTARVGRHWLDCIEVEDWAEGIIRCERGPDCRFSARNHAEGGWHARIRIDCEQGHVLLGSDYSLAELTHPSQTLQAELRAMDSLRGDAIPLPGKACYGPYHALQYQDFISAITADRPPQVGFAEAAVANQVVLASYHSSACGGTPVELPLQAYRQPVLPLQERNCSIAG